MCGICGELRLDGREARLEVIAAMLPRLERRGPDHGGSHLDGPVALGHRRLAIIDLSERANQPMVDPDLGLTLVFNGAIYNYRELREELRELGYRFFTDGDSEVILKAYHAWGEGCVERLHGMFAFAIWHAHRKTLFLARDRLGIKPLYYSLDGRRLLFASNTQALLATREVDTTLDTEALHFQFTLHGVVPAPRTVLRGIRKLPPAHCVTLNLRGHWAERRYWSLPQVGWDRDTPADEWPERIEAALREAVRRRLEVADVPVGVLLSGGVDSSLLVALLAQEGVSDLHTYSIGFEDVGSERGSEFEYSDRVVARYPTLHRKFSIPNAEVLPRLPEAVDAMAEPMFGQDAVAFYLLAERVSQEIKVVQSGQGADEVFAGYFWYPRMAAERQGEPVDRFARHYFDRDHAEYLQMIAPAYQVGDVTRGYIARRLAEPGAAGFLDQVLRLDVTTLVVDDPVKRVDNMTMAWGLEARVPFLDHRLVEEAMAMPAELKLAQEGKAPLKTIARKYLPAEIIDRPKGYFPMPALKYVRGAFLDFMREVLESPAARARGLYNPDYLARLLAEPERHHTRLQGSKLWHLAVFEFWLQRHVDALAP